MQSNRALVVLAAVAGAALLVLAVVYFAEPAKSLPLPNFLGHEAGSTHHHVKHGIAALLLGLACFAFAWFQSGPRSARAVTR
jgi:uncharacterized RDD family membrane protein YckC